MKVFPRISLLLALITLVVLSGCHLRGCGSRRHHRDAGAVDAGDSDASANDLSARRGVPHFAKGQLEMHFEKHGAEMGFATKEDFLQAAQELLKGGPGIETFPRREDVLFYKAETNEFAVLSNKNVIRTYFKPSDGKAYWERMKHQ